MASATRLPVKTIAFTITIVAAASASRVNLRAFLTHAYTGPGSYSRIIATLIVLLNIKNLPFAWHFRVFNSILKHCLFSIPKIPPHLAPSTLFLPVITSSHAPLTECDYNYHKSNSTYFSDADITRGHLVCCLLQPGIAALQDNARTKLVLDAEGKAVKGRWSIMLGGVMTSFKKEIAPYQAYEMWSRMLCWDRKWIYIVTHFVKKGAVKPESYILTDGSWWGGKGYRKAGKEGGVGTTELDQSAILASSIGKYVVKLGRLTTHPEITLKASGLLPERPGGWATMQGGSERVSGEITPETLDVESKDTVVEEKDNEVWDWKRVEKENKRGLKIAEHFGALDGLHSEFTGSQQKALGRYRDFLI